MLICETCEKAPAEAIIDPASGAVSPISAARHLPADEFICCACLDALCERQAGMSK